MPGAALPVNTPLVQLRIGDAPLYGAISLQIEQVAYFAADRFAVTVALGDGPLADTAYFASFGLQTITIAIAVSDAGYVDLFTGQIDNIRLDLLAKTATLSGRDLSARLIDTEISETFANQTASQIATEIAERHGLNPNVTATTTPVGQYYELDHARSALSLHSRNGSEWNLLSALAQLENFILSVTGMTLNFGPLLAGIPSLLTPQNCIGLSLDVATTIPSSTTVKSWNTRNKTVVTQTSGSATGGSATLIRPNLTSSQAGSLAANHLSVLTQHATILRAEIAGELALTPASPILLRHTNTAFDQTYLIDSITRSIDARNGFLETIRAHALAS
jgi:phage protein D